MQSGAGITLFIFFLSTSKFSILVPGPTTCNCYIAFYSSPFLGTPKDQHGAYYLLCSMPRTNMLHASNSCAQRAKRAKLSVPSASAFGGGATHENISEPHPPEYSITKKYNNTGCGCSVPPTRTVHRFALFVLSVPGFALAAPSSRPTGHAISR